MNIFINIIDFGLSLGIVAIALDKMDDSPKKIKLSFRAWCLKLQLITACVLFFSIALSIMFAEFKSDITYATLFTHTILLVLARGYFYKPSYAPKWSKHGARDLQSLCKSNDRRHIERRRSLSVSTSYPRSDESDQSKPTSHG